MPYPQQKEYVVYNVGFYALSLYGTNKTDIREQIRENYGSKDARKATIEVRNASHFKW